jgi:BirA family biotin operon repressor/biotin-[acetyl-CoA-carboxylase] ligase
VVVAERQTSGRGRLGREWESPARAGLALSVLLRPAIPVSRYGWLPLLAGVALTETVRRLGEVDAVLKWPNDLLIDDRKCAGVLAESVAGDRPAVVIGIGLNVTLRENELPTGSSTSLALAGAACTDRDPLLRALLRELAGWYAKFVESGGDPEKSGLAQAYRVHCTTLGRAVTVSLPGRSVLVGNASDVDSAGRLLITDQSEPATVTPVAAGDVIHVR